MRRIKPIWILLLIALLVAVVYLVGMVIAPTASLETRPGTGIVTGILDTGSRKDKPYNTRDLYLATLVNSDQPDKPPVVSFTYGTDPQTTIHEANGKFAFTNVLPNTYVLIIWSPAGGFPIESPAQGYVQVKVEADKTTDLGTVVLQSQKPYPYP